MQSILLYSMVLSRWVRRSTYMRKDAGEEGGRKFSSKMPRTMSNLSDFPRRQFLYAHLCVYTKSMGVHIIRIKHRTCSTGPYHYIKAWLSSRYIGTTWFTCS